MKGKIKLLNSKLVVDIIETNNNITTIRIHPESLFMNVGDSGIHVLKDAIYNHWLGCTGKLININKNNFLLDFGDWKQSFPRKQLYKFGPGDLVEGEIIEDNFQIRYSNGEWSRSEQLITYFKIKK
jgi:hypothetical protein